MTDVIIIGGATLYFGDCREILPTLASSSAEISVTSPPYNLAKKASGGGSSKKSYVDWYPDELPERLYRAQQVEVIEGLLRVCKSSIFYNHRVRYAWHQRNEFRVPSNLYHPMDWLKDFPLWAEIGWDRGATSGHANGRFRLCDERVYQIGKPCKWADLGWSTVWRVNPEKGIDHACPFPIEIPRRCILSATDPGDSVIDPYMGSGTTGVSCVLEGRKFIGIESDQKYFDLACERVDAAFMQSRRFSQPSPGAKP